MSEVRRLRGYYAWNAERAARMTKEKTIEDDWDYVNSPLSAFEARFRNVIPKEFSGLKDFVERTFAHKAGRLRGLELGGTGSALFAGFTPGFFERTGAVCLVDSRDAVTKAGDISRNHKVFPYNFLEPESNQKVGEWLGEVDVLFESMVGGHGCLPNNPFYMGAKVAGWMNLLSEDSLLIAEIPNAFSRVGGDDSVHKWEKYINDNCRGVTITIHDDILLLRKVPGSPKHLPLLPARVVLAQEIRANQLREGRRTITTPS